MYILYLAINRHQYHNACVKLPALVCCGHGHVSSSSLLQRTASAGRTFALGVTDIHSITDITEHGLYFGKYLSRATKATISVTGSLVSEWDRIGIASRQSQLAAKRAKPSAAERLPLPPLQWRVRWSPPTLRYQISNIRNSRLKNHRIDI